VRSVSRACVTPTPPSSPLPHTPIDPCNQPLKQLGIQQLRYGLATRLNLAVWAGHDHCTNLPAVGAGEGGRGDGDVEAGGCMECV